MSDAASGLGPTVFRVEGLPRYAPESEHDRTMRLLLWLVLSFAVLLAAGLAMRMVGEAGMTNSYALLADAFLHGRLDITQCVDIDCAFYNDQYFVVFPPGPALIAMPFVAIFGVGFAGFVALTSVMTAGSMLVWWRILARLRVERMTATWILIALAFGTPIYYVTARGDGVWFLAQATGFLFITLALWAAIERRSLFLIGSFLAFAFLCRQLTILIAPFVFALYLRDDERLFTFRPQRLFDIAKLLLPIAVAIGAYMIYNYVRFGAPLDTGYAYIGLDSPERTFIFQRAQEIGLFSPDYFLFNLFYLFFPGFHVEFAAPLMVDISGMDRMGTSILAASPFVLMAVFVKWRRPMVVGALTAAAMIGVMLLYHSNGFSQYNVQRYVLDWLPIVIYALALTIRGGLRPAFAVLVTYAVGLNLVTAAVAYVTQSS